MTARLVHGVSASSWWGSTAPPTEVTATTPTWVGITFWITVPGRIFGFREYVVAGQDGNSRVFLWTPEPITQRSYVFRPRVTGANGWQQCWIQPTYRPPINTDLRLAVLYPAGQYFRQVNALSPSPITRNGIQFRQGWQTTSLVPETATLTTNLNANGIDILFQPD